MQKQKFEGIYLFLISILPLSIIIGPSISLLNTLLIVILFLITFNSYKIKIEKIFLLYLLIILYVYLILNSFISIDYKEGIYRNLGFLRFVILFIAINLFFKISSSQFQFLNFWSLIVLIVVFDSFVEFSFGKNLLGYGDDLYVDRIVSFFKDEPIVGAYLLGFNFIIVGYLFEKFYKQNLKLKLALFFILFILVGCILITGERSNGIKAIIGLMIFLFLNNKISAKIKILIFLFSLVFTGLIISNSNYLKVRYGQQLFTQLFDNNQRDQFIQNNLYLKLYKSGLAVFKDNPIFGVGNKNYRVITTKNIETKINEDYILNTHPHQIYIELLSEHGLVGTIILLSIFFYLIFKNLKIIIISRNSIQLGCFTYLIINFLPILPSGSFFNDFSSTLFWINLSIMYACNKKTNIFNK
ncbi:O-antigen ligase family protein [Candidatus Pelagibacter communis]|uniref:O-antigen ligase family protein n=1 Tax=Pelagibacter ubique TaxID=198252 RepID=UPI00094CC895|nr:O-antigen ligase family protein [Candidatus Pelagibacter ubique]